MGTPSEDTTDIQQLHSKLRGLLLLRRSKIPEREYPSIMRELPGNSDYGSIVQNPGTCEHTVQDARKIFSAPWELTKPTKSAVRTYGTDEYP